MAPPVPFGHTHTRARPRIDISNARIRGGGEGRNWGGKWKKRGKETRRKTSSKHVDATAPRNYRTDVLDSRKGWMRGNSSSDSNERGWKGRKGVDAGCLLVGPWRMDLGNYLQNSRIARRDAPGAKCKHHG